MTTHILAAQELRAALNDARVTAAAAERARVASLVRTHVESVESRYGRPSSVNPATNHGQLEAVYSRRVLDLIEGMA